ncbi:MAG: tRNA (N(6)-L-threonylcarbamoyladenosine(37)-C(2))-methylthiotransferase MtaB [Deltaproteobacteria bacterium]|nr:tRNA (N(6)-L-threonylcarbamoyladenosine(37)-C(2))-methylthiotransferase MtaB [Deltaproteobacteria bacterium]
MDTEGAQVNRRLSNAAIRVSITTLGCKSNQYDSSALVELLSKGLFNIVPFAGPADACIINTCTVTGKSDREARQLIRKARRTNPDAVLIVTGCYAEVGHDEISRIPDVDYIIGNAGKHKIIEYILKHRPKPGPVVVVGKGREGVHFSLRARSASGRTSGRTRAYLKIQEGCSNACSYCIIPKARGASRSLLLDEVSREISLLVEKGFKEIILTGIHLGLYGADMSPKAGIASVIRLIEEKAPLCRFRLSSLDACEVTDELIGLLKDAKKVCRHLHLPLQSGDNTILRSMGRPYTREYYAERVQRLFDTVPGISIGADVIAGFPGEGDKEFENTYSLLKDLPLSYLHIFPFSRRKGTPAASFSGQNHPAKIKERCSVLKGLDQGKRREFYGRFIGKDAQALVESERDKATGLFSGWTDNYIPVILEHSRDLSNTIVNVRLMGLKGSAVAALPLYNNPRGETL